MSLDVEALRTTQHDRSRLGGVKSRQIGLRTELDITEMLHLLLLLGLSNQFSKGNAFDCNAYRALISLLRHHQQFIFLNTNRVHISEADNFVVPIGFGWEGLHVVEQLADRVTGGEVYNVVEEV